MALKAITTGIYFCPNCFLPNQHMPRLIKYLISTTCAKTVSYSVCLSVCHGGVVVRIQINGVATTVWICEHRSVCGPPGPAIADSARKWKYDNGECAAWQPYPLQGLVANDDAPCRTFRVITVTAMAPWGQMRVPSAVLTASQPFEIHTTWWHMTCMRWL